MEHSSQLDVSVSIDTKYIKVLIITKERTLVSLGLNWTGAMMSI